MNLLEQCNPDALVVAHLAFQGVEEITSIERMNAGGIGYRMSYDKIPVIELANGNAKYMRSQGLDALPEESQ